MPSGRGGVFWASHNFHVSYPRMNQDIRHSILKTLAFFEGFSMPLHQKELQRFLHGSQEGFVWAHVLGELQSMESEGLIRIEHNHYFFTDNTDLTIVDRMKRKTLANQLLIESKNWLALIASFPGVESIAICNNLAFLNATDNSDVDLFIITKPGQLWQTRFFLAALLQLFKKRPSEKTNYGKFCLSFFITSDKLNISPVLHDNDPYFEYWFSSLLPIYDPKGLLPTFMEANRDHWKHIGLEKPRVCTPLKQRRSKLMQKMEGLFALPAAMMEEPLRKFQKKRFPKSITEKLAQDQTDVVVSDAMLKFHTKDRRLHYRKLWEERLRELGL
jgi:hypothetical protein